MLTSASIAKLETFDDLDVRNKPEIRNLLEVDEKILFSGMLNKINRRAASQERMLVVTNKNIYNIQPEANLINKLAFFIAPQSSVKRKIPISKVWGITLSPPNLSDQFVIHIDGEYDYLYESKDKREKVLKSICYAYFKIVSKQFPLYIKNDANLTGFTTTDEDYKAGLDKKPIDGKLYITREHLDLGLGWIMQNSNQLYAVDPRNRGSTSVSTVNDGSQFGRAGSTTLSTNPNMMPSQFGNLPQPNTTDFRPNGQNSFIPNGANPQGSVFQGPGQGYPIPPNGQNMQQRPGNPFQNYQNGNQVNPQNNGNPVSQEKKAEPPLPTVKAVNYNALHDMLKASFVASNSNVNINFMNSQESRKHLPY